MRVLALLVVVALAGCSAPAPIDAQAAVDYLAEAWLAGQAPAPKVAQAAAHAGADLAAWPEDAPILAALEAAPPTWPDALWTAHAMLRSGQGDASPHIQVIQNAWDGQQFGSNASLTDDAWAVFVLGQAGHAHRPEVVQARLDLLDAQHDDGGWSWNSGPGNIDETAWVLAALHATGGIGPAREGALGFMDAAAGPPYGAAGVGSNCQSTAMGLWAESLLGHPGPPDTAYIASCQTGAGGLSHTPGDDAGWWSTVDVLVGLDQAGLLR